MSKKQSIINAYLERNKEEVKNLFGMIYEEGRARGKEELLKSIIQTKAVIHVQGMKGVIKYVEE